MKVYYLNTEYEAGKHKIIDVWAEVLGINMPNPQESHSILEFDEYFNRNLARLLVRNNQEDFGLPDKYYIDGEGKLRDNKDNLVIITLNPQREEYKLSQLYGLTQAELETYIDNNVTNLVEAKAFLKKLSAVVLWLVKQSRLEEI